MDRFLYDNGLRHESVNLRVKQKKKLYISKYKIISKILRKKTPRNKDLLKAASN